MHEYMAVAENPCATRNNVIKAYGDTLREVTGTLRDEAKTTRHGSNNNRNNTGAMTVRQSDMELMGNLREPYGKLTGNLREIQLMVTKMLK